MRLFLWVLAAFLLGASGASAQDIVLKSGVAQCVQDKLSSGGKIAPCLEGAQSICTEFPGEPGQTVTCYETAKSEWGDLISGLLDSFSDREEQFREVARIEAKYSVQRNLMACARQAELSLIGRDPEVQDQLVLSQCESQAMGVAYVELLVSSGEVTRN